MLCFDIFTNNLKPIEMKIEHLIRSKTNYLIMIRMKIINYYFLSCKSHLKT